MFGAGASDAADWFWFFVEHFFLFAGRRAVESTRPTGFCIIVHVGIRPASFFVFCVVNVCAGPVAVANGGRRTTERRRRQSLPPPLSPRSTTGASDPLD